MHLEHHILNFYRQHAGSGTMTYAWAMTQENSIWYNDSVICQPKTVPAIRYIYTKHSNIYLCLSLHQYILVPDLIYKTAASLQHDSWKTSAPPTSQLTLPEVITLFTLPSEVDSVSKLRKISKFNGISYL